MSKPTLIARVRRHINLTKEEPNHIKHGPLLDLDDTTNMMIKAVDINDMPPMIETNIN